jgi:hypothetical protein
MLAERGSRRVPPRRVGLEQLDAEDSPFDLPRAIVRPFPFETGSAKVVGDDLAARGHLLRCLGDDALGLAPPAHIVEFGPGWSNLTNDLVATGFHVTAVEISEQFCTLIRERCPIPANLTLVRSDMLTFAPSERYDAAVFIESFHHCSDHLTLLRNASGRTARWSGVLRQRARDRDALSVGTPPRRALPVVDPHLRVAGTGVRRRLFRRRAGSDGLES